VLHDGAQVLIEHAFQASPVAIGRENGRSQDGAPQGNKQETSHEEHFTTERISETATNGQLGFAGAVLWGLNTGKGQRINHREAVRHDVCLRFPGAQLPGVVVMLQRDVMPGVLIDAGCGLFQCVGLKR
jgi:hypothetical protein